MRPQSDCPGLGNLPGAPSLRCSHGREMLGHPVHECDSPRLTEFLSVQWLTEASLQQLERCCYPCLTQEADFHERPQLTSFHTLITTTTTINITTTIISIITINTIITFSVDTLLRQMFISRQILQLSLKPAGNQHETHLKSGFPQFPSMFGVASPLCQ